MYFNRHLQALCSASKYVAVGVEVKGEGDALSLKQSGLVVAKPAANGDDGSTVCTDTCEKGNTWGHWNCKQTLLKSQQQ